MPIEIKEVIIKTTVEKDSTSKNEDRLDVKAIEALRKEILKSCEHMINSTLRNQSGR